jgi:hypothetical protein
MPPHVEGGVFVKWIAPSLGMVLANIMFISPVLAVIEANSKKIKTMSNLNLYPYVVMVWTSLGWTCYGYLLKDEFIIWSNVPATALGIFSMITISAIMSSQMTLLEVQIDKLEFQTTKVSETDDGVLVKKARADTIDSSEGIMLTPIDNVINDEKSALTLLDQSKQDLKKFQDKKFKIDTLTWIAPLIWGLFSQIAFVQYKDNMKGAQDFIGYLCIVQTMVYFSIPLIDMKEVCSSGDSSMIYPPMILSSIVACLMWATYGIFGIKDPMIWGPNLGGLILNFVNLFLVVYYPNIFWKTDFKKLFGCGSNVSSNDSLSKNVNTTDVI